jgi:signal transduction histidine kinase
VRVEVTDTGPGIAPDDLPRIFERFYKADMGEEAGQGTGLGLSIARHAVEAHGGRIAVESRLGRGSTFRIILPLVQSVRDDDGEEVAEGKTGGEG